MRVLVSFALFFLSLVELVNAQQLPIYKSASYTTEQRVADLIKRMTPTEKFWQLFMIPGDLGNNPELYKNGIFGFQVSAASSQTGVGAQLVSYNTKENALLLAKKINQIQQYFLNETRLGIPFIPFDEALHGLVRNGATSFPQSIALAASFDTSLMRAVSTAIAIETKARGIRDILSPVLNIATDARWGRTEETYGEDPFLVTQMAAAYLSSFESKGIVTTPKHFIANVGDGGRDSYPIHLSESFLDELHFPPFKHAVQQIGARSIMTSYNSVNGSASSANNWLLNKKLKQEWGFKGFVISDAGAVGGTTVLHHTTKDYPESGAAALINGLDVIFQTNYDHHHLFIAPFLDGTIPQERIDDAVSRVLKVKFQLGLFDHPYVDETIAAKWVNNTLHKPIAKEAAIKGAVLLKNSNNVLPLNSSFKKIGVFGKDAVDARLGGYSGPGNGIVNILDGIKKRAIQGQEVFYAEGAGITNETFKLVSSTNLFSDGTLKNNGLIAEYFSSLVPGESLKKTRKVNDINESYTFMSPDSSIALDHYSIRYSGFLKPNKTGNFEIALEGNDGFRLYLNNKLLINQWAKISYRRSIAKIYLEKGKSYQLKIEFYESKGNGKIKFLWKESELDSAEIKMKQAVEIAKKVDINIVVAGIHEGEFQDRSSLSLPGNQEALIRAIAATGKPIVVLLVGGSAITMQKWIDKVNGIMMVWYPGEEGGNAIAALLYGDENPAGRLPITFPQTEGQLPMVYNHKPTGRGDDYHDLSGEPLFPFGYGLSYTQFKYSNLLFTKDTLQGTDSIKVRVDITNTGNKLGDEVVQMYIRDELSSLSTPVLSLKAFNRVQLNPGQTKTIEFDINASMLSLIYEAGNRIAEAGSFRIMIGPNSKELVLKRNLYYKH
ncbi:MAG TPA: glycoside hydrolase family 3 C-terminal domain-containing protein [Sediminibacterium sp.]|uniref:glycoside hydrolase family 3 C-terminal domain-containing protein n=1 Tax=Sediminibacterium sp. TaxID=1917865 RepID=UPI0008C8E034|nr:glycoside hydrolase family 3 C-terminal domain-containing protein [Sediminibacterium sp.]OHC84203.1 MAG: beta-1,3-glucosyltransferase [Sphingobacteriia bacterium RIFOXYC2_FULL_35_18]OHC88843.1 MAG: beta-1,3-glucosyltransferase [Sphingobacteriia bacterium RIFOXYD2_FULL_35_12]HLD53809.1 glycoside hydrolase family 3 C-terminal domain-containing protein [Sediminibacterium sp.]